MARAEELVAVADERAAALQRRLADAEAEMARMEGQVAASRDAVVSREGEVKRLTGLLEGGQDVDYLALQAQAETKDDLIMSLSQQAEAGSRHFVHVAYFALVTHFALVNRFGPSPDGDVAMPVS